MTMTSSEQNIQIVRIITLLVSNPFSVKVDINEVALSIWKIIRLIPLDIAEDRCRPYSAGVNNPEMWLQVVHILSTTQSLNTKFFALQVSCRALQSMQYSSHLSCPFWYPTCRRKCILVCKFWDFTYLSPWMCTP